MLFEAKFQKRLLGRRYVGQVGTAISWPEANEGSESRFCRARKMGLPILDQGHCGPTQGLGCAGVVGAPGLICKVRVAKLTQKTFKILLLG